MEDRFAEVATIITSQLPVNNWYDYTNENTVADGVCDRLTANANRIELKGESLRERKKDLPRTRRVLHAVNYSDGISATRAFIKQ